MPACGGGCERRAVRSRRHTPTNVSTSAGRSCSAGSSTMRIDRARAARYARAAGRWARLVGRRHRGDGVRVFYGHDVLPAGGEPVAGGTAKFQRLAARFPNRPADFTLLYLGSTLFPRDLRPLLAFAQRRSVPIVLNQNGVAYPGWAGRKTARLNRANRRALEAADHVLYQSEFSKRAADA